MALEHFTAILAHELLDNPRHPGGWEAETAGLWRWHAVEEIEHKGVAYDTWLYATRDWPRFKRWKVKAKVMLLVTRNFLVDRTAGSLELMRQDGVTGGKAWGLLLSYLWLRPGVFRKIGGAWLSYFLPGFHPWNVDDRHLLGAYAAIASGTEPRRKVRRAARRPSPPPSSSARRSPSLRPQPPQPTGASNTAPRPNPAGRKALRSCSRH